MIDTYGIRTDAVLVKSADVDVIFALCDEIDRLRESQAKVTALEAIRDAASSLFLTSQNIMVDGEPCHVVDHDKLIAMSALILRENDHQRGEHQTPPQGKMVEVKIPVVVTPEGKWHGYDYLNLEPGCVRFWLTATLPVPAEVTVVAKVEGE